MVMQARIAAALVLWLLAGWPAGAGAGGADVPLPRPRPPIVAGPVVTPHGPPTDCDRRLESVAVFTPKPTLTGPGACGGADLVELSALLLPDKTHVAVAPPATLRCGMAESLAGWLRDEVAPRLAEVGGRLASVEQEDAYECRHRNRAAGGKVSEHGKGNAIDLRGFGLLGGGRIVLTDVAQPKALREALRDSACRRFTTVLGPGSDGHHEEHIHLDVLPRPTGYRICQWDVRTPTIVAHAAVPLPPPRPAQRILR
jgi:hypothetical protein